MKKFILPLIFISLSFFFFNACSTQRLDTFLHGDTYRLVSKEKHDRQYPRGHRVEYDEIPGGNKCVYDKTGHQYFCQFSFYDDEGDDD